MFTINTTRDRFTHHVYDIDTLQDILLGLIDDESEANRITAIAGNMRFGDVFSNHEVYLKCKDEEENYV
jgi:hypothetical protein